MAKFRLNKITFKTFIVMAIPLALQNLVTTSVSLADNLMVGALGDGAIATVNLANQFFFIFNLMIFGMGSGSAVLMAQFWGKREISGMRKVAGLSFFLALFIGSLFGLISFMFPSAIMKIFSADPSVIEGGIVYIRIIAVTYPLTAATMVVSYLLKSSEEVKIPLVASALSILINICFNYLLIFGKFGFPKLGIAGAAYATLLARVFECTFIYIVSFIKINFLRENIKDYISFKKELFINYIKTSCPVILNETLWSLGISFYFVVYSRIGATPEDGTAAVAAVNVSSLAEKLSSVFIFGMSHAVSIIIGKEIGSGRMRRARFNAWQFSILSPCIGVIFGIIMVLFMPIFISFFAVSPQAEIYARHLILILAFALPIKNFNLVNIVGVFRGGGDTVYSCLLDVLGVWCIGIPSAAITGFLLKMPLEMVFMSTLIEELVKFFLIIKRLKSGKWVHYLV